jgi:hypothetical protein
VIPYDSEIFLRALMYLRRSDQDWINHNVITPELLAAPRGAWNPHAVPENLAALDRLVRMLRKRGVQVHLVIAPYHRAAQIDVEDLVTSVSRNGRVWNYANAFAESRYFADRVDMNQEGSEVLLRMLQRDGVL